MLPQNYRNEVFCSDSPAVNISDKLFFTTAAEFEASKASWCVLESLVPSWNGKYKEKFHIQQKGGLVDSSILCPAWLNSINPFQATLAHVFQQV